jgi:tRNA (adenine37-N6)-methyltransferase
VTTNCPLTVIGFARTDRLTPDRTPVQAALNSGELGTIELVPELVDGLAGLADFEYLWLVAWLGTSAPAATEPPPLTQVPFLLQRTGRAMGIFATRGPRRINPIGLSLVRLVSVEGSLIRFAGVDVVDGTPIVDIKPYVGAFDRPPGEPRCGWFDQVELTEGATPEQLR